MATIDCGKCLSKVIIIHWSWYIVDAPYIYTCCCCRHIEKKRFGGCSVAKRSFTKHPSRSGDLQSSPARVHPKDEQYNAWRNVYGNTWAPTTTGKISVRRVRHRRARIRVQVQTRYDAGTATKVFAQAARCDQCKPNFWRCNSSWYTRNTRR